MHITNTESAREILLAPTGITISDIDQVLGQLRGKNIDAADIYFEASRMEAWVLEDGLIKEGSYSIERGVGVRAISEEKTGFAYSEDLTLAPLLEAAKAARAIAHSGGNEAVTLHIPHRASTTPLYQPINPLTSIPDANKVELLQRVDTMVRASDPRIIQVIVSLVAAHDVMMVVDQDGAMHGDVRPLVRLNVNVIAEQHGRREQGSSGGGGRQGLEWFLEAERY